MKKLNYNTESFPLENQYIDKMSTSHALDIMLNNQAEAIGAVRDSLLLIEQASEAIFLKLKKNKTGRIIYCGAGTSARIGVQDAAELNPTFGWPLERIDFIIAGGINTLISSQENIEDNIENAEKIVNEKELNSKDCLIGISASGSTPFTSEVINLANKRGVLTIGIANNRNQMIQKICNYPIILETGMEIVAGSTRLKAGTAQKICLNLISTIVMTKFGFVKNGMMVNMKPSNQKLRIRSKEINKKLNKT